MLTDLTTIVWKETKELLFQRGQERSNLIRQLIFMVVFGVVLPLQNGLEAVRSPAGLVFWMWIPYLLVSGVTADTFAGERERHTLETLLASRLSDRAILFGKLAAVILYGWGLTLATLLVSLVAINIAYWQGQITFYTPFLFGAIMGFSLLVTIFGAGLGIAISLRAATARAAQQTLSIIMFAVFIPLLGLSFLPPEFLARLNAFLARVSPEQVTAGLMAALLVFDAALVGYALARFQRGRLISD